MLYSGYNYTIGSDDRCKAGVYNTIKSCRDGGVVGQVFTDKLNPVIDGRRFKSQTNSFA